MSREADLKKFHLVKEMMCDLKPNLEENKQFWHFVGEYDPTPARAASKRRKDEVEARFAAFIAEHAPDAFDVASNWGPMSGFGVEGLVLEAENAFRSDRRFIHPMQEIPGYAKGRSCYLGKPNIKTEEGEKLSDLLEQLNAEVQGPIEFSDFVLDGFGLHKAVGSFVGEKTGKRVMVPPQVISTCLGLFLTVPKERLYEMPEGFEQINHSVTVFATEVDAFFRRQAVEDEAPFTVKTL